jgi:hypothetical protein
LQQVADTSVQKVIGDVDFLVHRSFDTLGVEFPAYLKKLGFSNKVRNRVCM